MVLFGLINYEDFLLKTIVKSNFSRNGLTVLLMYLITTIIRFHLSLLICSLFTLNTIDSGYYFNIFICIFNFMFPILIGVILSLSSNMIYLCVDFHRSSYEKIVDHIINNYNIINVMRWKRYMLVGFCIYVILAVTFVNINNQLIFISTLQAAISFIICDLIENKNLIKSKFKIFNSEDFPDTDHLFTENLDDNNFEFIMKTTKSSTKNSDITIINTIKDKIPPKPPTPPQILNSNFINKMDKPLTPPTLRLAATNKSHIE